MILFYRLIMKIKGKHFIIYTCTSCIKTTCHVLSYSSSCKCRLILILRQENTTTAVENLHKDNERALLRCKCRQTKLGM